MDKKYRLFFAGVSLALILAAATPTLALFIRIPDSSDKFSELWLLDLDHRAENYPFNIRSDETNSFYVGVGNHLGYIAHYRILGKLRNQTQPMPVQSNATPSPLPSLYEFDFFVDEGATWEKRVDFIVGATWGDARAQSLRVNSLWINGIDFRVNSLSIWDEVKNGFYYNLFFELWLYNMSSGSFEYHNRFVGLRLNVTAV
jgi:hypothetical protein